MPSNTNTLQQSINWAQYFVGNRPLALSAFLEPALTSANTIIQAMLAPPFKWRWNRNSTQFSISPGGGSDYLEAVPDFGFIEKAYLTSPSGQPIAAGTVWEIPNKTQELAQDAGIGRPQVIAPYLDDNQGNITFRIMPGVPDQTWNTTVIYQKRMTLLTALGSVWPIPDIYANIYNTGFLGMILFFAKDERAAFELQRFAAQVISISDGLTEQDKNSFLDQWDIMSASRRAVAKAGQGLGARSAS
jgi:hypothetical protein